MIEKKIDSTFVAQSVMNSVLKNSVMLIDDSVIDAFINQKMIQKSGFAYKIYVHNSSESALEFFRNFERIPDLPSSLIPRIIFLDLNMPNQDGFEFIDELNKFDKKIVGEVKIVFVTSSNNLEDINRAKNYTNVLSFINKPLTYEHIEKIRKLIFPES